MSAKTIMAFQHTFTVLRVEAAFGLSPGLEGQGLWFALWFAIFFWPFSAA